MSNKKMLYGAISFFAMLAVLLPNRSTFAKAQVNASQTGTLRQENEPAESMSATATAAQEKTRGESETGTLRQENEPGESMSPTATAKQENGRSEAEEHRSVVALFVQNLLQVADRNTNGIGEQVRAIAKDQEASDEAVTTEIEAVENRSSIKTFLIGTDYKNIGMIRSEMVKTDSRIDQLNRLLETMTTSTGSVTTSLEIQNLTNEQTKLENFLKQNESKFSLFGWFVKLFNK